MNRTLAELAMRFCNAPSERYEIGHRILNELRTCDDLHAVWHPLGFIHARFFSRNGKDLRLHIWPSSGRRTQDPPWRIHDHVFGFTSVVLAGRLSNHTYAVSASRAESLARYRIYHVTYRDDNSVLVATNLRVDVQPLGTDFYQAGEQYDIQAGVFHDTHVDEHTTTATLLTASHDSPAPPRVVGEATGQDEYRYYREPCDRQTIDTLLAEVADLNRA